MRMFDVTADYRSSNPNKPHYYVLANNKKDCRRIFNSLISWLKIYDISEIEDPAMVHNIRSHPSRYIILGRSYD